MSLELFKGSHIRRARINNIRTPLTLTLPRAPKTWAFRGRYAVLPELGQCFHILRVTYTEPLSRRFCLIMQNILWNLFGIDVPNVMSDSVDGKKSGRRKRHVVVKGLNILFLQLRVHIPTLYGLNLIKSKSSTMHSSSSWTFHHQSLQNANVETLLRPVQTS